MKILHSSDLHGHHKRLIVDHAETDFDVWLDTGPGAFGHAHRDGGRTEERWGMRFVNGATCARLHELPLVRAQ